MMNYLEICGAIIGVIIGVNSQTKGISLPIFMLEVFLVIVAVMVLTRAMLVVGDFLGFSFGFHKDGMFDQFIRVLIISSMISYVASYIVIFGGHGIKHVLRSIND
jgi:hypothetical protein